MNSAEHMMSEQDEPVIATNDDATECKRSAVELGYWKDDYIQYFTKRRERKPPEINRGYFVRVRAIETLVYQFLEHCGSEGHIVNLGCGYDTLFWRLKERVPGLGPFTELDLPAVVARKTRIIMRNSKLRDMISTPECPPLVRPGSLRGAGYSLLAADLRRPAELARALPPPAAPLLALAECVLVYLPAALGDRLLALLAGRPRAALVLYEQVALDDGFGRTMLAALRARGLALPGAAASGLAGARRLRAAGWRRARAWGLAELGPRLLGAAAGLEPADEGELLDQLHRHYALLLATNGDLLADMGLD